MKAHKVTLLIIDHDKLGADGVKIELEGANYANDCIAPYVKDIETVEIGEWSDNHPLNKVETAAAEYHRLFRLFP
jgi:hypothetical protein